MNLQMQEINPAGYRQEFFLVERERAEAERLLVEREANAVQLGRHFERAKKALTKEKYGAYVKSLGLIPLTAEGFILQARMDRGEVPPAKKMRRNPGVPVAVKIRSAIRNGASLEELDKALTEIIGDETSTPA